MNNSILQLKNVNIKFEKSGYSLQNFNICINRGDFVGIVGESGSGKTTIGKLLVGLINQSERGSFGIQSLSGDLKFIDDQTALSNINYLDTSYKELRRLRKKVQMIFQNHRASLNLNVTVYDTLKEAILIGYGKRSREFVKSKIVEISSIIGLIDNVQISDLNIEKTIIGKKNRQLSGGQMKRVSIAKTICLNPEIIVADEPLTGLDASKRGKILQFLSSEWKKQQHLEKPLTLIIISHDIGMIAKYCHRIVVIYGDLEKKRGSIVEEFIGKGSFSLSPSVEYHPYTRELVNAANYFREGNFDSGIESRRQYHSTVDKGCVYNLVCPIRNNVNCESNPPLQFFKGNKNHLMACYRLNQ